MPETMQQIIMYVARGMVLLLCLPVHELAHGFIAYKLGDSTAKNMGRLTLNPIKHLDLFGSIALLVVGIGWAKPVPVNPYYFKNPKAGMAITAFAGPLSNFIMAFLSMIFYKISWVFYAMNPDSTLWYVVWVFFYFSVMINISLGIFNLIPIPPFDGSRIASYFLPERMYFGLMKFERYTMIAVILVLWTGVLDGPLRFLNESLFELFHFMTGFVDVVLNLLL